MPIDSAEQEEERENIKNNWKFMLREQPGNFWKKVTPTNFSTVLPIYTNNIPIDSGRQEGEIENLKLSF
jgi:hypothetical protein